MMMQKGTSRNSGLDPYTHWSAHSNPSKGLGHRGETFGMEGRDSYTNSEFQTGCIASHGHHIIGLFQNKVIITNHFKGLFEIKDL